MQTTSSDEEGGQGARPGGEVPRVDGEGDGDIDGEEREEMWDVLVVSRVQTSKVGWR